MSSIVNNINENFISSSKDLKLSFIKSKKLKIVMHTLCISVFLRVSLYTDNHLSVDQKIHKIT